LLVIIGACGLLDEAFDVMLGAVRDDALDAAFDVTPDVASAASLDAAFDAAAMDPFAKVFPDASEETFLEVSSAAINSLIF
jgi:hypothetical protein